MQSKTVLAVVEDLFFVVKIKDAAKRAGVEVVFLKSEQAVLEKALDAPALIILDLNISSVQPIPLIAKLKTGETRHVPLLGFVSHVQTDLRAKAEEVGCETVVPRSVFSQRLQEILQVQTGGV